VRLDVVRRLKPPASPTSFLLRAGWKYALGVGIAAVLFTAGTAAFLMLLKSARRSGSLMQAGE